MAGRMVDDLGERSEVKPEGKSKEQQTNMSSKCLKCSETRNISPLERRCCYWIYFLQSHGLKICIKGLYTPKSPPCRDTTSTTEREKL